MGTGTAVAVPAAGVRLDGDLAVPAGAVGVVLFAHGSGSSRHSPRNRAVAAALAGYGLGTLLVDLLTPAEERVDERTAELRFDIDLLADRVVGAVDWLTDAGAGRSAAAVPGCGHRGAGAAAGLPVGLFGASTGAAAALVAAARRPAAVRAVVSRGGRPDLAGPALPAVRAPTLLLVGDRDTEVVALNEAARRRMTAPVELRLVPGATHLFGEPGALERVAAAAGTWLRDHLPDPA
ncbi:hydrolase [Pilimelia anulata]|uniref:Hydrolase n=1 Tax=Pilimelia anulata TaxID=53371 RepID=A0A8J3B433_9ACTN|nr:dienelactone hydrolase family protein [Pilimelia anulata]GGJ87149.1 hydrolase [Pilimelia anulata]